jgi:uncharacterized membrane protein
MQKTGKYYRLTIISSIIAVVGSTIIFLSSGRVLDSTWGIVIGMAVASFGGGVVGAVSLSKNSTFVVSPESFSSSRHFFGLRKF